MLDLTVHALFIFGALDLSRLKKVEKQIKNNSDIKQKVSMKKNIYHWETLGKLHFLSNRPDVWSNESNALPLNQTQ